MASLGYGFGWLGLAWLVGTACLGRRLLGFATLLFGFCKLGSYSWAMAWLWWAWIRYDYGAAVPNAISSNL
jgi:hypothetical protein